MDPVQQIAQAVQCVRNTRHRHDCHCGKYQHVYCTPAESIWCHAIDRLLDQLTSGLQGEAPPPGALE